ncbi:hypothetical protein E2562_008315 [Oryza meyeriana var. granulata]|uniref:Peptidase A2 domain-containing protein n=1 Tax=Oryza meyeriana var. granulata TaxID=110450 RepID=A0A6G1DGY5_9ORYZ|nr:hypothetical protein E2562_008315 [Oryza meyeriana var. granulata]
MELPRRPSWVDTPITFTAEDGWGRLFPHNDALVITVCVAEAHVHRILVDGGSSADILFASAFNQLRIPHIRLTKAWRALKGFSRDLVEVLGQIELPMRFGRGPEARTEGTIFDIVVILGKRPTQAEVSGGMHAIAADLSHPERHIQIGDGLPPEAEEAIIEVL